MSGAPDLAHTVAGYRSWRVANGKLMSPYIPCRWDGRVIHAECFDANRVLQQGRGWLREPHASPHPDCQCGIYAYDRPGTRSYYGEVWWCEGVIAAWGRLVVHSTGWRAEHARVEALAVPDLGDARLDAVVAAIAERLGVPVVERGALADVAEEAGGLVPETLRP